MSLVENGHKTLDYMQNMFSLLEKNWLHLSDSIGKHQGNDGQN